MGGDLGSDAGTVALNIGAKTMEKLFEALQKLLSAIGQTIREAPNRKMMELQLREAKTKEKKLEIIKRYEGVAGEIQFKKLQKYAEAINDRLLPKSVHFANEEEIKRFGNLAKSYGLAWSGIRNKENLQSVNIFTAERDIPLLNQVLERHKDELKIEAIDNKIAEIMGEKEYSSLSEQEQINIDCLQAEKIKLQRKTDRSFNSKEYNDFLESVLNPNQKEANLEELSKDGIFHGEKSIEQKQMSFQYEEFTGNTYNKNDAFSASLDAKTGRNIDKDRISILADISNPDRYIKCHGSSNPDLSSKQKIITKYTVYNAEGQSKDFTDDNKINKWSTVKEEMRRFGGFSRPGEKAVYLRFSDPKEFTRWQSLARTQQKNENIRVVTDGELQSQIAKRMEELSSKGYELTEDGSVARSSDKVKAEELAKKGKMLESGNTETKDLESVLNTRNDTLNAAEAVLIGKEIANYQALQEVNGELAIARTNETVAELSGNESEKLEAIEQSAELQLKYEVLKMNQEQIVTERKELNGLQSKVDQELSDYQHNLIPDEKIKPIAAEIESALGIPHEEATASIQNYSGATRMNNLLNYARNVSDKADDLAVKGQDNTSFVQLKDKIMDLYKSEMGAEAERERNRTGGERSDTMEDKQMSFDDGGVKNEIESRKESAPIGKNINKEINQAVKTKAAKEHGK